MLTQADKLVPAFDDAVHQSQQMFRRALMALSEPGTRQKLAFSRQLDGLHPATYALCLTLLDEHSAVWCASSLDSRTVRHNLAFHCGSPVVEQAEQAAFALLNVDDLGVLDLFDPGTDRDPHLSCTVVVQLESLDGGSVTHWQGPGIAQRRSMHLPVPGTFWQQRQKMRFPCGVDVLFVSGDEFVALPRSTRVLHSVPAEA
jgi:alpha-D-ribose 1-methylphosphonate 5-triphosphate synthase subunit PhnH